MKRSGILVILTFLLALTPGFAQRKPGKPKPASVSKLKSNLGSVRKKKKDAKLELHKVRSKIRVVKGTLEEVNERIESIEGAIIQTDQHLDSSKDEQKRLAGELTVATHELQLRTREAQHRLKVMRMKGQGTFVSAVMGARSVGDLASRKFLFERIAQRDHDLFTQVRSLRASIQGKKNRQDQLVGEIASLKERQKAQHESLGESKADQSQLLAQLRDKEGDLQKLIARLDSEENSLEATIAAFTRNPANTAGLTRPSGRLLMPVAGARIGSGFGMRYHPILHRYRMHKGVDLGARSGVPIRAAADGVVIMATRQSGYGNVISIAHGGGIATLYGHCSRLLKSPGARVRRGETIALVGSTGLSTGPHCHFEVRINGKAVNPRPWL